MDPADVEVRVGTGYPPPFDEQCRTRERQRLGDAVGLSQYGVNLLTLPPGAWSAHRHWHRTEDEFIYVLDGEVTLITDAGEQALTRGMFAGFPAGKPDGHNLVNKSDAPCQVLEIGTRPESGGGEYSDIDMKFEFDANGSRFLHKNGDPY